MNEKYSFCPDSWPTAPDVVLDVADQELPTESPANQP